MLESLIKKDQEYFFFNGFIKYYLDKKTDIKSLKHIFRNHILNNTNWLRTMGEGTKDLKSLNKETFKRLDICFNPSKISKYVSAITGHSYLFGGYLIRIVLPNTYRSYFYWHRDYYKYQGEYTVGPFPPQIKFIYTPLLYGDQAINQFKYKKGSNNLYLTNKYLDKYILPFFLSHFTHKANDDYGLLFNGFGLHSPTNNLSKRPALRIIMHFFPEYNKKIYTNYLSGKKTILRK